MSEAVGELPDFSKPHAGAHKRASSDLSELSLIELDRDDDDNVEVNINDDLAQHQELPKATLVVVAETDKLEGADTVLAEISDFDFTLDDGVEEFRAYDWDGKKFYSDLIKDGLDFQNKDLSIVMLFESPSTSTAESSFHNKTKFKFHDWPPPKSTMSKQILGPCRYASMNGPSFPLFLRNGKPPSGLEEHWTKAIPGYRPSTYVDTIRDQEDTVYAYLPVEQIRNHLNNPDTHYHLAGKDTIHMMTQKTTRLLPDTRTVRPCVVKTTHSMGSKGIFIIQNDEDEAEFENFLLESGNPTFVVTDFVDIARNVACHFFMHPDGSVVWFGSNENHREADGSFSSDSYLLMEHQEKLKELQLPFVEEVARYCLGLGFWGFCGVDVLFDSQGRGNLVDINPRVTGSCPALMTLKLLSDKYGFMVGLFRRSGNTFYYGTTEELVAKVTAYNDEHEGKSRIVVHSFFTPKDKDYCKLNIGVYGNSLVECKNVLNEYAKPAPGNNV